MALSYILFYLTVSIVTTSGLFSQISFFLCLSSIAGTWVNEDAFTMANSVEFSFDGGGI